MLRNYVKIAIRYLLKHKTYSIINISGLAIGMTCIILILLWIQDELNFDGFHKNANQIYRIVTLNKNGDKFAVTPNAFADALVEEVPEVIHASRFRIKNYLVQYDNDCFKENISFIDNSYFEMFSFPFTRGNLKTALSNPFSVVITEATAKKYFGKEDPIGNTIQLFVWDRIKRDLIITGIIKDIPFNSHLRADIYCACKDFSTYFADVKRWNEYAYGTYVMLRKNSIIQEVENKINECSLKNMPDVTDSFFLQPLENIYLYSNFKEDYGVHGNIQYVYIFSLVAFFILVIACINFVNLSIALSARRTKEVGLRKVIGAKRSQLIWQFLGESTIIAFIALCFALILVELLQPAFLNLTGKSLSSNYFEIKSIFYLIILVIASGVLAGSYPALILSSFLPQKILKGTIGLRTKKQFFRKALIVLQFSISIIIIIATIVVSNQLHFIKNINLGFEKGNIVYLRMAGDMNKNFNTLKNELLKNPNILSVSGSSFLPKDIEDSNVISDWEGKKDNKEVSLYHNGIDYDFLNTYKMEMASGRFFSKQFSTDFYAVVLNEAAVKALEIQSPIGKRIRTGNKGDTNDIIIGVVKDFHFRSLHQEIEPLFLYLKNARNFSYLSIRIRPTDIPNTIMVIENAYKKICPAFPFEFHFLDKTIEEQYRTEQNMNKIFSYFTFLSIFISCLGLFGLACFTIVQRNKEIGVRKVFGASITGVVAMLTKDFFKWVIFANIFAWPVAYYTMNKWLQNFTYRISIEWWVFVLAGVLTFVIALFTVSWQAIRASIANPVKALRYE